MRAALAIPLVSKNADGQFFVTMTAEAYLEQAVAAANWHLYDAARKLDRALKHVSPLPSGEQRSWRRGTWV